MLQHFCRFYCSFNSFIQLNYQQKCAIIALNRPQSKNALNLPMIKELQQVLNKINTNDIRVLLFRSLIPNIFCAGADLKERLSMTTTNQVQEFLKELRVVILQIYDFPVPTICTFDGPAYGGGFELGLACDLRVASSDSKFGLLETRLGIIPGAGGTQLLPRLIPVNLAKELIFTGRILTANQAERFNVINHLIQQNETFNAAFLYALNLAIEIAELSAPLSVKMAKKAINNGLEVNFKESLDIEYECYANLLKSNDRLEGLQAFSEKRKPTFSGN